MPESRYNPEFATFLEAERMRAGLGVSAFAARLGISPSHYRQLREGYMPRPDRIRAMATAWGADPEEWVQKAGTGDELGGIPGEKVSASLPDSSLPVLGEIGEHGIIELHPEGVAALEGNVRFALRVATSSPGALLQAGDVVHFETCETAKRNGAWHVNHTEPRGRRRGWFGCPNRGEPFDRNTAAAVMDDIDKAGGIDARRHRRDRGPDDN